MEESSAGKKLRKNDGEFKLKPVANIVFLVFAYFLEDLPSNRLKKNRVRIQIFNHHEAVRKRTSELREIRAIV
jgi:hypothetical protein